MVPMVIADFPPRVAIVANGATENSEKILDRIHSYSFLVAVDGGCNACYTLKLSPQLIIGDMDSISPEASAYYADVPKLLFPSEKDETDLELALNHLLANHVKEITVFGGLGNRVDHTLGNIILLSRFPGRVFLESDAERLSVVNHTLEFSCSIGQTISLIPVNGPVSGIRTTGLKWPLNNGRLDKMFIGISNVATQDRVKISVEQGDLLCVINFKCP